MVSRRVVVGGAGALALAGVGYRAWDRGVFTGGEGPAYQPWSEWRGFDADGKQRPLHAAILAANPHDTQPWLFAASDNSITVVADRARNLGTFDPFRREMHLGLGCAIENLVLASSSFGFSSKISLVDGRLTLSPSNAPVAAAEVRFGPIGMCDVYPLCDQIRSVLNSLVAAIPNRHTNRGPYFPDRPVTPQQLHHFSELINGNAARVVFINDRAARAEFAALMVEATQRIVDDPQMPLDSAHWFRTGARDVLAHRDGIVTDFAGLSPLVVMGAKMLPDQSAKSSDQYWLGMTRDTQAATAPLFGMILVKDRLDMRNAIEAGRAWQRLHLAATMEGLAAQPMNQPVEMVDRNAMLGRADSFAASLAKFANAPGWEPTFTFRMGYAERPAMASPRRPLSEVLQA